MGALFASLLQAAAASSVRVIVGASATTRMPWGPNSRAITRVVALAPTITLTELAAAAWSNEAKSAPMMARHPMGRFAEAEDVARAISLLLSDDAAMITGSVLPVDGGFLAN
jgi:NAD(P)-dependent dehydrogenase (short-subunit alcohol dehydrogenase family)